MSRFENVLVIPLEPEGGSWFGPYCLGGFAPRSENPFAVTKLKETRESKNVRLALARSTALSSFLFFYIAATTASARARSSFLVFSARARSAALSSFLVFSIAAMIASARARSCSRPKLVVSASCLPK